jgi:hypothetical protein
MLTSASPVQFPLGLDSLYPSPDSDRVSRMLRDI